MWSAITVHLFPCSRCRLISRCSSASFHPFFEIPGTKWLYHLRRLCFYLSRHCLPDLRLKPNSLVSRLAITAQFLGSYSWASRANTSSS
jgi:hypothetical protein